MPDILDDDFLPTPPSAERIAARALVLAAVSCRAMIEADAGKQGAEDLRNQILPWLKRIDAARELEPKEVDFISVSLGKLDSKRRIDGSWESESMATLAWVLQCSHLPAFNEQCDAPAVADSLGFLGDRSETPLNNPVLRSESEIDKKRDTYLTLHWRLRQYSNDSQPLEFREFAANCAWADMRLDELEIVDNDLAIDGRALGDVEYKRFREILSITQVRHQALNWLLGFETLYSAVTTDT